ncbi:tetraspanin-8-like [Scomber scombrus]|uniref:Tetraspanin-8-like n=1 Tax=Scomber scombrus TaxID=13677 RepID=A0AAV1PUK1_SCOSC
MGKINECLKRMFIFFNSLFLGFGCMMIYGLFKASAYSAEISSVGGAEIGWLWAFAIGVLIVSSLGIYAGKSENNLVLKIFAGLMVVGLIIMLIFGFIVVGERNKIKASFTSASSEYTKPLMDNAEFKSGLRELQQSARCCGVTSATDWGYEIPETCACDYGSGCTSKPQGTTGPDKVYGQTCGGILFAIMDTIFQAAMGIYFGFAVTAFLGLLVSVLMIHQIKRHDSSGAASISMKGF